MYKAAISEQISLKREVGKWAAQTLVASAAFNSLEALDGEEGLSEAEIYGTLSEVLKDTDMTELDIAQVRHAGKPHTITEYRLTRCHRPLLIQP